MHFTSKEYLKENKNAGFGSGGVWVIPEKKCDLLNYLRNDGSKFYHNQVLFISWIRSHSARYCMNVKNKNKTFKGFSCKAYTLFTDNLSKTQSNCCIFKCFYNKSFLISKTGLKNLPLLTISKTGLKNMPL